MLATLGIAVAVIGLLVVEKLLIPTKGERSDD